MGLRDLFRPRQVDFLALLQQQARLTLHGLQALEQFAATAEVEHAKRVVELEKDEDELRRILIDELNRNFVTPIDREDIFALSRAIDDIIDYANTTVDEMTLLGVSPTPIMRQMVTLLREAAEEIHLAVEQLKEHPWVASTHAVRAKSLENQVEAVYRQALLELFEGIEDVRDVVRVLKMREVYRHLSNAADRGDAAANVIADIVVKMT